MGQAVGVAASNLQPTPYFPIRSSAIPLVLSLSKGEPPLSF